MSDIPGTIHQVTTTLQNNIAGLENQILWSYGCLQRCNFVVVSKCKLYTIGAKDKKATVEIEANYPTQWEKEYADELAATFKAKNGHGAIIWEVLPARTYHIERLVSQKDLLALFTKAQQPT